MGDLDDGTLEIGPHHVPEEAGRHADVLLDLAEAAIRAALAGREPRRPDRELPPALRVRRGAFVTLHVSGELNGCIGNIDGVDSIADDVGDLAVKAAFDDPRLPALRLADLANLSIEISLLSRPVEIPAGTRTELLRHLRIRADGLIIEHEQRRGIFLPVVWEQLPHPDEFLDQLLRKAGLRSDPWPAGLSAAVFTTASVQRRLGDAPAS